MKYNIGYINGHDLKFRTFTTTAESHEEAIHNLYKEKGDFDHQIIWCNDCMKEISFPELGYFTGSQIDSLKKALEGESYMKFHISSCSYAGNHTLVIKTDYEESEEKIKKFFLYVAFSKLAQIA